VVGRLRDEARLTGRIPLSNLLPPPTEEASAASGACSRRPPSLWFS
jgi:hypothetical protein